MKRVVAFLALAACESRPDVPVDAPGAIIDASPARLAITEVMPAGGQIVAIGEMATYLATVKNEGGIVTGTIGAQVTGSADFTVINGCTFLSPGGQCTIEIRLIPSTIGSIDGQLVVTADPGGTATMPIHGTGQ